MAQATYSIRLDQTKKSEFDQICEQLGLSASAAISTFINKTVEMRGLPYALRLESTPTSYGIVEEDKLTREELMAEIQKGIDSAKHGKTYTTNEVLKEIARGTHARI